MLNLLNNRCLYFANDGKDIGGGICHSVLRYAKAINTFCQYSLNKLVLLLRIGAYSYEYIDSWDTFNESLLPSRTKKLSTAP